MAVTRINIIWKFSFLVFILNLQECLSVPNVDLLNDNSLNELNDLYNKWVKNLLNVPDAAWMFHSSSNPKLNWHGQSQHRQHGNTYHFPSTIDDFDDLSPDFDKKIKDLLQQLEEMRDNLISEFNSSGIDVSDFEDRFPTIIPRETKETLSIPSIVPKHSDQPYIITPRTVPMHSDQPTITTSKIVSKNSDQPPIVTTERIASKHSNGPTILPTQSILTPSVPSDDFNRTINAFVNLINSIINDLSKINFTKIEIDISKDNLTDIEDLLTKLNLTILNDITKLNETFIDILENLNSTVVANILLEISSILPKINKTTIEALLNKYNFENYINQELLKRSKSTSNKCNYDLIYLMFKYNKQWTTEMLDAAGKLPSGLNRGTTHWMGDFRQCRNINVPQEEIKNFHFGNFKGEYCYVSWNIQSNQMNFPLYLGICVPDSCSSENLMNDTKEIAQFLNYIPVVKKINKYVNVTQVTCQSYEKEWEPSQIVYMCILAIFAFLMLVGTLCDILKNYMKEIKTDIENGNINSEENTSNMNNENISTLAIGKDYGTTNDNEPLSIQQKGSKQQESFLIQFLICFSVYTNGAKVFKISNRGQLDCLYGIRFLSMSWIILGHSFFYAITIVDNIVDVLEDIDTFSFQVISQATFSVDTFFLLSGFLLSYLFLKEHFEKQNSINWAYYYIHRIWRLTPAFAMLLGFYATVWLHLGSGPLWPSETNNGNCKKNWWWNLLYILNFKESKQMCMGWTWYLANDMQFYIISPLFLLLLWKSSIIGIIAVGIVLLVSWIVTGVLSIEYDLTSFLNLNHVQLNQVTQMEEKENQFFDIIYDKPYCRIGPYLIGIITGYALYLAYHHRKFINNIILIIGWIIALFFGLSVIFGLYHVDIGLSTSSVYNAVSRTTWGIAVAWVIFVCLTGHGGPVNKILSWKIWIPLSRLTYCAYLVHPMIIQWYYNSLLKPLHFEMNTMVLYYFGFLLFSYLAAFVASMAFESPMMALEKLILQRLKKRTNKH